MKKTRSIIALCLAMVLIIYSSSVTAYEAPHNDSHSVDCLLCHNSPNWAWGSGDVDPLCLSCHDKASAPYATTDAPLVKTHKSAFFTSQGYGSWTMKCTDCHSPHYQKQRSWQSTVPGELFLATGTITGSTYNSGPNTTDLVTSGITYKSGWNAAGLIAKTSTDRYAILMPSTNKPYLNFPVQSISGNTITVKGNAKTNITAGSFGVIYGHLIKDVVTTPNSNDRAVKFLDKNAFVNGAAAYNGICEVCHTQTEHYRNNGAGADQNHSNVASDKVSNCTTECHKHSNGFAHGNTSQDHAEAGCGTASNCHGLQDSHPTHVGAGGMISDCFTCHKTGDYQMFADNAASLAATTVCNTCHSPGGAYDGVNNGTYGVKANWAGGVYTGNDLTPGKEAWCISCHDNSPANSKKDGSGVNAPNKAGDGSTYGYFVNGHGKAVGSYAATGNSAPDYDCLVCHDKNATHINHSLGDDRLKTSVNDALNYTTDKTELCLDCHKYNQSANGTLGDDATAEASVHGGSENNLYNTDAKAPGAFPAYGNSANYTASPGYQCSDCHDPHGTNKLAMVLSTINGNVDGASNPVAVAGFQSSDTDLLDLDPSSAANNGVCDVCHTAAGNPHPDTNRANNHHQGESWSNKSCAKCHWHYDSFAHGSTRGVLTRCLECHDHSTNGAGPPDAPSHNSIQTDFCATQCHMATGQHKINDVHDLDSSSDYACFACHTSDEVYTRIVGANSWGDATANYGNGANMGGTCTQCHDSIIGSNTVTFFDNHINRATKHNNVSATASCTWCHDNNQSMTWAEIEALHNVNTNDTTAPNSTGSCATCHKDAGSVVVAAIVTGKSVAMGGSNSAVTCTTCHIQGNGNAAIMHGLTASDVATGTLSHDKYLTSDSSTGYDCTDCHTGFGPTATQRASGHMNSASTTADCLICHNTTLYNTNNSTSVSTTGPASTVIAGGRSYIAGSNSAGTNTNQTCEDCHDRKGQYKMHGMLATSAAGANTAGDYGGIGSATATGFSNVIYHDMLGNSTGIAPSYTGKLAGAYGGLKAGEYNCGQCHSDDPDSVDADGDPNITALYATQLHMADTSSTTGYGNCLTCHTYSSVSDEITEGKSVSVGGANTVQSCEDCHASANNNGLSGKGMYQYDGTRHHKTQNAQEGDCTYCHADPRPATPTKVDGTYAAYAATADTSGTSITGWVTDYSLTAPTGGVPKQPACRLCHTNYGTDGAGTAWSVNTSGGNGTHGYNISGYSGTATERTTGLTVYANNFNAGLSGAGDNTTVTVNATRTTQTVISSHRINANNGTSMIKVFDYGACFTCHAVQIMHAAPVPGTDYPALTNSGNVATDVQKIPWDTLRYAPGRAVFNLLRGTNTNTQAWNDHRLQNQNGIQNLWNQNTADPRGKTYIRSASGGTTWYFSQQVSGFTTVADPPLHASVTDWEGLGTGTSIVKFADIGATTQDNVNTTYANYTAAATRVEVWAYSGIGSGQTFSFTYTGGAAGGCGTTSMSWDAVDLRYEGTCNTASGWTDGSSIVTVSNTTSGGSDTRLVTGFTPAAAVNDSLTAWANATTSLSVMSNDSGDGIGLTSLNTAGLNANCSAAINGNNVDVTCSNGYTSAPTTSFQYTITDSNSGTSTATVTLDVNANTAPTISIAQPDGTSDTVTVGASYNITYTLADTEETVTAAFYYDSDNSGLNGTAITGACATAAEGSGATCAWNTIGMTPGTYYVYGKVSDGFNAQQSAYSSGQITINANATPTITVNQPDGSGDTGIAGGSFTINYDANDTDGTISVDFYYDSNNSGADGTAIASCQDLTTEGAGLTCNWTSLPAAGDYYVYAIVTDNYSATATDYSSGVITVIPPIALLAAGGGSTENYTGAADSGNITYNIAGSSSDNRLLVVSIAVADTGFTSYVSNMSATYGGQALTEITEYSTSNRASVWLGYLKETGIAAASSSTLAFDNGNTGWDVTKVQIMTFKNVNQTTPLIGTPYQGGSTAASSRTTSSLTMGTNDMPIYAAVSKDTGAHSVSTTASGTITENFENLTTASHSSGYKTDVTTSTSGTITVTFGGSNYCALTAAVLRSIGN